ncbi:MAG: hypothetical protein HYY06_20580 [Deltaproteobacteria bacterium]|nr:hypothetical protein [Deltaproteobacteria bacterium]
MSRPRKLADRVPLFCGIEKAQHAVLRRVALEERCSLADVVRAALDEYVRARAQTYRGTFDVAQRAREKRRSRAADRAALSTGRRTRRQLRSENSLFGGFRIELDVRRLAELE